MMRKFSSALSSLTSSPAPAPAPDHHAASRAQTYVELAEKLQSLGVPVTTDDCATCDHPCDVDTNGVSNGGGIIVDAGGPWDGKPYGEYVMDQYGDLGSLPNVLDTDWDSELPGSARGGRGRIAVVSTGKSDWPRDHYVGLEKIIYMLKANDQGRPDDSVTLPRQVYQITSGP